MTPPPTPPIIAVGILAYNGRALLPACLDSVLAQDPPPSELVVVDNGSSDGSVDLIAQTYPQARLIQLPTNLGVAQGLNHIVAATTAPLVVLLNQDVELRSGCLAALAATLTDPAVGVVGAKLLFPDGTLQHAGGWLEWPLFLAQHRGYGEADDGRWDSQSDVEFVTGAVFAVRRTVWDALGGMADVFTPAYFEETDFCLRARGLGWRVVYQPHAVAIHHESTTLGRGSRRFLDLYHRNRWRLLLRHASVEHLLAHVARAEARRTAGLRHAVGGQASDAEVAALTAAYADAAAHWPTLFLDRGDAPLSPGAIWAVSELLIGLHSLAETSTDLGDWQRVVLPSPQLLPTRNAVLAAGAALLARDEGVGEATSRLDAALDAAERAQSVHEVPFQSTTPLLGRLVVRFREAWNWMSTKWYVRPMVAQQNEFNQATTAALRELARVEQQRDTARQALSAALSEIITALEVQRADHNLLRTDHETLLQREDAHYTEVLARIETMVNSINSGHH